MTFDGLMKGKKGLIMGVANDRSIAWGVAKVLHAAGAELAFTYQGDVFQEAGGPSGRAAETRRADRLRRLQTGLASTPPSPNWAKSGTAWISWSMPSAFSDKEQLKGRYVDTTAENFRMTMDISCYSFTAVAQRAEKMMNNGGSLVTLTYYGAEKVMPHYNVMGVAKAALEASVRYMAEDLGKRAYPRQFDLGRPDQDPGRRGIGDFRYILKWNEYNSPLRRNVTPG